MSGANGQADPARRDPAAGPQSRVLIVHGDAATRQVLVSGVAYQTDAIVEATSARAAVDCLAAEPVDLILLGMSADVGGIQLLRLLKGDSASYNIPVIMIAAPEDGDGVLDCLEAGADDYLSQPIHQVLLRVRVSAALDKKRLRETEKSLREAVVSTRQSHDRTIQRMLAVHKLEFGQLQDTIKALRKQLDGATAAAKAGIDAARAGAAAELRQLRATCRLLREQIDKGAAGHGPGQARGAPAQAQGRTDHGQ